MYLLWTRTEDPQWLKRKGNNGTVWIGQADTFRSALKFKDHLEMLLAGKEGFTAVKEVWITDGINRRIGPYGRLKDDYRVRVETLPEESVALLYRVTVLRVAIVYYQDGTPVPGVKLPEIPVAEWFSETALTGPEDPEVLRQVYENHREAIID